MKRVTTPAFAQPQPQPHRKTRNVLEEIEKEQKRRRKRKSRVAPGTLPHKQSTTSLRSNPKNEDMVRRVKKQIKKDMLADPTADPTAVPRVSTPEKRKSPGGHHRPSGPIAKISTPEKRKSPGGHHRLSGPSIQNIQQHHDPMLKAKKTSKQPSNHNLLKESKFLEQIPRTRLDAVVATVVFALILGGVALYFEWYVYMDDRFWNDAIHGDTAFRDAEGKPVFRNKTINLNTHESLRKVRDYSTRSPALEIAFISTITTVMGLMIIHICACYIRIQDLEQFSIVLILLYSVGGALCIYSSTFLYSAAVTIEDNYMYSADMLYNFQHMFEGNPDTPQEECTETEFAKGCDYYQYARLQAGHLENIFRLCGEGSRYIRYYRRMAPSIPQVEIFRYNYSRAELKEMGFCSRDGYKYAAGLFAILMGIVCSIVPVVYCCESKDVPDDELSPEDDAKVILPPPGGGYTMKDPEPESEPQPETDLEPYKEFSREEALIQFITFVQKDSDEDERDSKKMTREPFQFVRGSIQEGGERPVEPPNLMGTPIEGAQEARERSNSMGPPTEGVQEAGEPSNLTQPPTEGAQEAGEPSNLTQPPTEGAQESGEPSNLTQPPTEGGENPEEPHYLAPEPPTEEA